LRLGDAPFTAEAAPTLRNGAARELCVIAWSGGKTYGTQSAYAIEARLVDASGAVRQLPLERAERVVEDSDGLQRYVLTIHPKGVPAGRYALDVSFKDKASGATSRSQAAVQVE